MKKYAWAFFPMMAIISCNNIQQQKEKTPDAATASDLQVYNDMVIESLVKENDSTYRVQIGIMAAAFRLHTDLPLFNENYALLNESFQERVPINIAVQKNSNAIIHVTNYK